MIAAKAGETLPPLQQKVSFIMELDINTIGYFLYMEEQENRPSEETDQEHEEQGE